MLQWFFKKRLLNLISIFFAPFLMLLVVVYQIKLQQQGLSPWKGGGMGMYSDFNPLERQISLHYRGFDQCLVDSVLARKRSSKEFRNLLVFPTKINFYNFGQLLRNELPEDKYIIQVWGRKYDIDTNLYKRVLIEVDTLYLQK